ncbi:AIR synthase [Prochlorococcus sp. MIT 1341]|uniref:AIR synthase n=1 Tax=Prochlorococcus sp. MIT 1341 TaxID=3096221 RepID=UPI002A75D64A|nr:AIR synthase [Prochlorococcus sp. MIT 1341]
MHKGQTLSVTPTALAELSRQAAFGGMPGRVHIDLLDDPCGQRWLHIRLRPGDFSGVPIFRTDGVTIYAPKGQLDLLKGLSLSYYGDLSGGGFLISSPRGAESCACGAGFRFLK